MKSNTNKLWHNSAAEGTKMMGLALVAGAGILGAFLAPFILMHIVEISQSIIPGIWLLTGLSLFGFSFYHKKKSEREKL